MKLMGLIGGMSWENTIDYYRIINEMVKNRLGEWYSAEILLYSVNFEEILQLQNQNNWKELVKLMIIICRNLELAGSKAIVICSNTMHKIATEIEAKISIPLINVVDETAKAIKSTNIKSVGLLGTKFTMEGAFYAEKLAKKYEINTLIPDKIERNYIHKTIYQEFAKGKFLESTKEKFLRIIENLIKKGAEGIILGCTELPMLINSQDVSVPLYDTLKIHLRAAVNFSLT
ncbi:MAG: aspartate/glutamate racemase family protein [Candidatus Lokiarchaeota archaeon]|nr:aspartate/glutamate racemase family protein [Candidatus Lokiarchaeota archaeon]